MLLPPLSDPPPSRDEAGRAWADALADEYGLRPSGPPPAVPGTSPGFPAAGLLYATHLFETLVSAFGKL